MNKYITKQQWDQLTGEQKGYFKEEIGEGKYADDYIPGDSEILKFLGNNGYDNLGVKELGDLETPQGPPPTIYELWGKVLKFYKR